MHPLPIAFEQAIPVAILGLIVNIVSAWLLHGHDHGGHGHGAHDHAHEDHHHHHHDHGGHHDFNLRAAYVHVAADALVSLLAIGGLLVVRQFGWLWVDPLMGLVGALVIAQWSVQLMRQAGGVLLDMEPRGGLADAIRWQVTRNGERITDLHVWRLGPGHHAAIVCLAGAAPKPVQYYRSQLAGLPGLSHVTVEIEVTA
jgi:cation diffusion facilitator family transporter